MCEVREKEKNRVRGGGTYSKMKHDEGGLDLYVARFLITRTI